MNNKSLGGRLLMGLVTLATGNERYGVLSIAVLFVAGFVALLFVPNAEAARQETPPVPGADGR